MEDGLREVEGAVGCGRRVGGLLLLLLLLLLRCGLWVLLDGGRSADGFSGLDCFFRAGSRRETDLSLLLRGWLVLSRFLARVWGFGGA